MQPKTVVLAGLSALSLAACTVPNQGADPDDLCGASQNQGIIGAPMGDNLWSEDLSVRVIDHDTMVAMDFVPTRMNVWVGRDGRIERVGCG